jgi:hypothetical protein
MSNEEIIETFYGKYSKFEVVKKPGGVFSSAEFYIRKDGKHHHGPYNSLRAAVDAAEKESGGKR